MSGRNRRVARWAAAGAVVGWASHGVFRAFEDGTVETLASPMPPCPQGDFYVWIRFPG